LAASQRFGMRVQQHPMRSGRGDHLGAEAVADAAAHPLHSLGGLGREWCTRPSGECVVEPKPHRAPERLRIEPLISVPPAARPAEAQREEELLERGESYPAGLVVRALMVVAIPTAGLELEAVDVRTRRDLGHQRRGVLADLVLGDAQRPRVAVAICVAYCDVGKRLAQTGVVREHDPGVHAEPGRAQIGRGRAEGVGAGHPRCRGRLRYASEPWPSARPGRVDRTHVAHVVPVPDAARQILLVQPGQRVAVQGDAEPG
jgi:hypothetical protein